MQVLDQKKSESKEGGKRSEAPGAERSYLSASDLFPPSFDSASGVCCQKVSNPPDEVVKKKELLFTGKQKVEAAFMIAASIQNLINLL